jgi:hypothetical protein
MIGSRENGDVLRSPWVIGTGRPPIRAQISLPGLDYEKVFERLRHGLAERHGPTNESDPIVALLDAWAVVSDVLGFYQQRAINEGYVGTALERRSIFELARMVGYMPDPGLAAGCAIFYTIDQSIAGDVLIPAGSKVRAIPKPGEEPQTFETSSDLIARAGWNAMPAATTATTPLNDVDPATNPIYISPAATALKPGDPGTITTGLKTGDLLVFRYQSPDCDALKARDVYFLVQDIAVDRDAAASVAQVVPRYPARGTRAIGTVKTGSPAPAIKATVATPSAGEVPSDVYYQSMIAQRPWVEENVVSLLESKHPSADQRMQLFGFRRRAAVFGHNAARRPRKPLTPSRGDAPWLLDPEEQGPSKVVDLEGQYAGIVSGSQICIEIPGRSVHGSDLELYEVANVQFTSRAAYGITGNVTRLTLDRCWKGMVWPEAYEEVVQRVTVHFDPIELQLSHRLSAVHGQDIELDGVFLGLTPGRLVIVEGRPIEKNRDAEMDKMPPAPRSDWEPELLTIESVKLPTYPTEGSAYAPPRTTLSFKDALRYRYDPKTVKVYGNVVLATHGESYEEILGSGNGAEDSQSFRLTRRPLTQLPSAEFLGAKPEIRIEVGAGQEEWRWVDTLARSGGDERVFSVWIDDASTARIFFGNGRSGARLPTGRENINAVYRVGLGAAGNVLRDSLKLAVSHPLGVQSVSNTRASDGFDPEPVSRVRTNIPLSTVALDRLVTKNDYLEIALTYPGIAKAKIPERPLAGGAIILTILGDAAAPLNKTSPICSALRAALTRHGDGCASIFVEPGILCPISIEAHVTLRRGAVWDTVEAKIRAILLETLGFEQRDLGQTAYASEALAAIQSVEGVAFVTLKKFHRGLPEKSKETEVDTSIQAYEGGFNPDGSVKSAELLLVRPDIPGLIALAKHGAAEQ